LCGLLARAVALAVAQAFVQAFAQAFLFVVNTFLVFFVRHPNKKRQLMYKAFLYT
jgi:hypothetical protein